MLSTTVTIAGVLVELPLGSVPVNNTVLGPKSAQEKVVLSRVSIKPQLSELPLSTRDVEIEATPLASKLTLIGLVITEGARLSTTVTFAVAEAALPCVSVTVNVTVLGLVAISAQVK